MPGPFPGQAGTSRFVSRRAEAIAERVATLAASATLDVVAFQEVWRARDAERLGVALAASGFPHAHVPEPKCGLALFSAARFPIVRADFRPFAHRAGPEGRFLEKGAQVAGGHEAAAAAVADDAKYVAVANAHLQSDFWGDCSKTRARQIPVVRDALERPPSRGQRARWKSIAFAEGGPWELRRARRALDARVGRDGRAAYARWVVRGEASAATSRHAVDRACGFSGGRRASASSEGVGGSARVSSQRTPAPGSSTSRRRDERGRSRAPRRFRRGGTAQRMRRRVGGGGRSITEQAQLWRRASGGTRLLKFAERGVRGGDATRTPDYACVEWRRTKPPRTRRAPRARSRAARRARTRRTRRAATRPCACSRSWRAGSATRPTRSARVLRRSRRGAEIFFFFRVRRRYDRLGRTTSLAFFVVTLFLVLTAARIVSSRLAFPTSVASASPPVQKSFCSFGSADAHGHAAGRGRGIVAVSLFEGVCASDNSQRGRARARVVQPERVRARRVPDLLDRLELDLRDVLPAVHERLPRGLTRSCALSARARSTSALIFSEFSQNAKSIHRFTGCRLVPARTTVPVAEGVGSSRYSTFFMMPRIMNGSLGCRSTNTVTVAPSTAALTMSSWHPRHEDVPGDAGVRHSKK